MGDSSHLAHDAGCREGALRVLEIDVGEVAVADEGVALRAERKCESDDVPHNGGDEHADQTLQDYMLRVPRWDISRLVDRQTHHHRCQGARQVSKGVAEEGGG